MDSTSSLSKGCFAFIPKSSKTKSKKKKDFKDEFETFNDLPQVKIYSSIMKEIEHRLKVINTNASEEVLKELEQYISSCPTSHFAIPSAVLLTGVNLPDHRILFQSLAERLHKEVTPHVSILVSSECTSVRSTVEQLTSQFLRQATTSLDTMMDVDESDSEEEGEGDEVKRSQCTMPNLVTWYNEQRNKPTSPKKQKTLSAPEKLVVIIPDFEGFSHKVLQELVLILSNYLKSLPLVLVVGVATSVKALQSSLPHRITSRMNVKMFQSKQSVHFLNNTVNEIFLSWKKYINCPFLLGPRMFKLLTDVFIYYDFSVHGFVQGIKYCLMEHFYSDNCLSKLCCKRDELEDAVKHLDESDLKYIREEVSDIRTYLEKIPKEEMKKNLSNDKVFKGTILSLLKNLHTKKEDLLVGVWLLHALVHDLPEAPLGKQVREVYVEVLSCPIAEHPTFSKCFDLLNLMSKQELLLKVEEVIEILQDSGSQSPTEDDELLDLRNELENAGQNTKSPAASPMKRNPVNATSSGRLQKPSRDQWKEALLSKSSSTKNEFEKARSNILSYLKKMLVKMLVPLSTLPLHEVMLIDRMSAKRHIVGAPRAAVHIALNNPHHYLQCKCCQLTSTDEIQPTLPDICIVYKLHLESQALINMYDWLQAFVAVVSPGEEDRDERKVSPALQARFTRAVSELQFLGFVKASKKKTDHVSRLTWGATY